MKLFFLIRLVVFTCLISISCFGQRRNTAPCTDTATYAILPFVSHDFISYRIFFTDSCTPSTLDSNEISALRNLISIAINEHNEEYKNISGLLINKNIEYKMQFVPMVNPKGEKIVWVNCFCGFGDGDCDYWRKGIIIVHDGGSCFFNLKINLSKKKWFDFVVNGVA